MLEKQVINLYEGKFTCIASVSVLWTNHVLISVKVYLQIYSWGRYKKSGHMISAFKYETMEMIDLANAKIGIFCWDRHHASNA